MKRIISTVAAFAILGGSAVALSSSTVATAAPVNATCELHITDHPVRLQFRFISGVEARYVTDLQKVCTDNTTGEVVKNKTITRYGAWFVAPQPYPWEGVTF